MRIAYGYGLLACVILFAACGRPESTLVPLSPEFDITVDGQFAQDEWRGATSVPLTPNHSLYLAQNAADLFVGLRHREEVKRYVDLYVVDESGEMVNLHASMQLGERQLSGDWSDTEPAWDWGNNRDWTANEVEFESSDENVPFHQRLESYEGHEFRIAKSRLRGTRIEMRFELNDFAGVAAGIEFPAGAARGEAEGWLVVELGPSGNG